MSEKTIKTGLPLVVQLGFAGSRNLFKQKDHPQVDALAFEKAVQHHLSNRLARLLPQLGLGERHFFCGLSQLAIGADTIFTRACQELGWPQRLLLPQHVEDFLHAVGAKGTADFTEPQRDIARELFASPHVIEKRVVSLSPDRHTRFHEVNLELVRISDLMVCLLDTEAVRKPGGTRDLIDDAEKRERPLLEIRVAVDAIGAPNFSEEWHHLAKFRPPRLPEEISQLNTTLVGIPPVAEYGRQLKAFASQESKFRRTFFTTAAQVIIVTHLLATGCAVVALGMPGILALPWLLGIELVLLGSGFWMHQKLHRSHAVRVWAMARMVAELARSVLALQPLPGYLAYLFFLPLPEKLRPLLRTLNVLHLRDSSLLQNASWQAGRDQYVRRRLDDPNGGQLAYYEGKSRSATASYAWAQRGFLLCSALAMSATALKLWVVLRDEKGNIETILGMLAVILPLLAVAALSLAASFDLEARAHTYCEMLVFLKKQKVLLKCAPSLPAFEKLALETEARLLGETANWYSRRVFTGVA
jgi:hypothetical protein